MHAAVTTLLGLALILSEINSQTGRARQTRLPACDVTSFEWMIGVWEMNTPEGIIVESWGQDSARVYHGTAMTIKNGDTVSIEKMRIRQTDDSGMVFVADIPHNKKEVSFELISGGDASMRFVFENLAHDFPQRVIYHLKHNGDSLYARIEGMMDGKLKSTDFAYKRDYGVTPFEYIIGVWEMNTPEGIIVESWDRDSAWVYHGTAMTIKNGDTVSIEKMRIQKVMDTGIVFVAGVPHNKREVSFQLVAESEPMRFVFENLAHDFPQRVTYQLKARGDSLYARIEGMVGGKLKSTQFAYRRK